MDNITFGRYINNQYLLTKIDARVKILMMISVEIFKIVDVTYEQQKRGREESSGFLAAWI